MAFYCLEMGQVGHEHPTNCGIHPPFWKLTVQHSEPPTLRCGRLRRKCGDMRREGGLGVPFGWLTFFVYGA